MKNTIYTLPEDTFVAGQTCKYTWRLIRESGNDFSAQDCTGTLAITNYSHKNDTPDLVKDVKFEPGDNGVLNKATVTLTADDTINLDGKYIYQLSIRDTQGNIEIPNQGILYIYKNINKSFITESNTTI